MNDPVYILIRTANRPIFFRNMMESIKRQTYKNIVTIVHSDNPNDLYVEGDILSGHKGTNRSATDFIIYIVMLCSLQYPAMGGIISSMMMTCIIAMM